MGALSWSFPTFNGANTMNITPEAKAHFDKACRTLSHYTLTISVSIQGETDKIPRVCQADAPNTFEALQAAWGDTEALTYAVASEGLEGSIYVPVPFGLGKIASPEMVNARARFWHDHTHFKYNLPFDIQGELSAAYHQCMTLALAMARAFAAPSEILDAVTLLWCDTAEQALHHERTGGEFVADQAQFVLSKFSSLEQHQRRRLLGTVAAAIRCA